MSDDLITAQIRDAFDDFLTRTGGSSKPTSIYLGYNEWSALEKFLGAFSTLCVTRDNECKRRVYCGLNVYRVDDANHCVIA